MDTTLPQIHYPDDHAPAWHSPYWGEIIAREQKVREEVAAQYRRDMKRIYEAAMAQNNLEMALQCQQALAQHYELYKTSSALVRSQRVASTPEGEEIAQYLQQLRALWLKNSQKQSTPLPENYYDRVRLEWRKRDGYMRRSLRDMALERTMKAMDKHERAQQAKQAAQSPTQETPAAPAQIPVSTQAPVATQVVAQAPVKQAAPVAASVQTKVTQTKAAAPTKSAPSTAPRNLDAHDMTIESLRMLYEHLRPPGYDSG